ncbi:hypothetical protein [Steroidobacter sp.]|uniref:hypothetical protein n=1 Tax=Steroidobacter sp. TaxID=1978227 RepID=UPI001A6378EC|nr:hypothetical protein [Steroidobacter sp.]MBL8271426.1 hypothetical protein [Steroidobacter sp.]
MSQVLKVTEVGAGVVADLLSRYGLQTVALGADEVIPGSYWGDSEAGLIGSSLYWRPDTPLHSLLHEAGHFICMNDERRDQLNTDAGGDYDEENGVCYLQILLAGELPGVGRERMCQDMDAWGYTFRLGSARAWFEQDATDARAWLIGRGLIDDETRPTWRTR